MAKHTMSDLYQMQGMSLDDKVKMTKRRIAEWVDEFGIDGVYVSFSGGKDSTVLLTIARQMYPDIKAVFVNTGLEYPEIVQFVKSWDNVDIIRPAMNFKKVIEKYGYPFFGKEISETIYGARKYLTEYNKRQNALTDRQTDRQTDSVNYVHNARYMAKLTGLFSMGDRKEEASEKVEKMMDYLQTRDTPEKIPYSFEMQRLVGCTGSDKENEPVREAIKTGKYKYGAPVRFLILKGELPHTEKGILKQGEISSMYNKSRYLFMLEAPFEVSNLCCSVMKKRPMHKYAKETGRQPITAQMASESKLRTQHWLKSGCNGFDLKSPISNPMSFWTEQDVLLYIWKNKIPIAPVYGDIVIDYAATGDIEGQMSFRDVGGEWELFDTESPLLKTTGCKRTGCIFCGFGCHFDKPGEGRFERLKITHPKLYSYVFKPWNEGGLGYKEVIDWINEHGNMNIRY